jgi:hypothetical protein
VKCLVHVEDGLLLCEEFLSVFDYISGCLKMIAVVQGELSTESLTNGLAVAVLDWREHVQFAM